MDPQDTALPGIAPADLSRDASGAPYSPRYGDVYATREGAFGQARHVFIAGNGLPAAWAGRRQFVILETGFGLGTNFLATWQAWRDDPGRPQRLHFVSIERHPPTPAQLREFGPGECRELREQLALQWPYLLPGTHRLSFEGHRVQLTLVFGEVARALGEIVAGVDAMYLDGFSPAKNPDMWSPAVMKALARLAREDATLATWSCARAVRDALCGAGFEVQVREGFGTKREMLVGRFSPRWSQRRSVPPRARADAGSAIVVGAGLSGCSAALALARRGWDVRLVDAGARLACGASALPAGLLHPFPSADHNLVSRIVQAGFLHARRELASLGPAAHWRASGVFQMAQDEQEDGLQERWLARLGPPGDYARRMPAQEAAARVGLAPRRGGIWFESGGVVSAEAWCRAMHDEAGARLRFEPGRPVRSVLDAGPGDAAGPSVCFDDGGIARADVVVLACATQMGALSGPFRPKLRAVPGQLLLLREQGQSRLQAGICGDGYLLPGPEGRLVLGATFEDPAAGVAPLSPEQAQAENLDRLARLLEAAPHLPVEGHFRGDRCVSQDRLPICGALADAQSAAARAADLRGAHLADLPRRAGLWCVGAVGTRGLALASACGELVASQIEGEPLAWERALAQAVDPARWLLRELRRGL